MYSASWVRETIQVMKPGNVHMETGQRAICRGVLALLPHEINGNSTDKLKEAQAGISNYLIDN